MSRPTPNTRYSFTYLRKSTDSVNRLVLVLLSFVKSLVSGFSEMRSFFSIRRSAAKGNFSIDAMKSSGVIKMIPGKFSDFQAAETKFRSLERLKSNRNVFSTKAQTHFSKLLIQRFMPRLIPSKPTRYSFFSLAALGVRGVVLVLMFLSSHALLAQNDGDYRSRGSGGNWNNSDTWERYEDGDWEDSNDYPGQNSGAGLVTILNGDLVTVNVTPANSILGLVIGSNSTTSATLTFGLNTNTLSVSGNVTINSASGDNGDKFLTINAGTLIVGGNLRVGTGGQGNSNSGRQSILTITSGNLRVSGNITLEARSGSSAGDNAQAVINVTGSGTINLGGSIRSSNSSRGTLNMSGTASNFNYNGTSAQTVYFSGQSTFAYRNLQINNTSASGATLGAAVTTTNVLGTISVGNISSSSRFNLGDFNIALSTRAITVSNSSTLDIGVRTITMGVLTLESGTISGTTGTITGTSYSVQSGTISAILAGTSVDLTKTTAGTVTLSGNNTFTGATNISSGTLRLGASGTSPNGPLGTTAAGTTVSSGAALDLNGFNLATSESLTLNGTGFSNGGALTNTGGNATYTGAITLASASEITATTSGTLTLTGVIGGDFTLTIDGAGSGTISGIRSGSGALIKDGSGTWTLSGANTYTGATTISAGTLRYGINNALSDGAVNVNGGTWDVVTFSDAVGAVTLSSGSITGTTGVITGTSYSVESGTISAILAGSVGLTKTTSGTVTLSGANTYTGSTTITGGVLQLGAAARIADTSNLILNGGTFRTGATTGFTETVGTLALSANSTIALGTGSHTLTFGASNAVSWTSGTTLTITGWAGSSGASGTAGKLRIGSNFSGLSTTQLAQIQFQGYTQGATLLSDGEVVPAIFPPLVTSSLTASSTYGTAASYTITASNSPTSFSATGLPAGMSVNTTTGVITVDATTNAGTYNITISATNGAGMDSKTLVYTVNKALLTITAVNQTVTYGTPVSTIITDGAFTPSGFVNGETVSVIGGPVSYTTTYTATTAAGATGVTITPVVTGLTATNYSFRAVNGTITISRASVTITPDAGQSKFIGGSDPVLTFQSSGWLGSDNAALLQGALSRAAGEAAGFYPITLGNLTETSGNYLLALTPGIQFEVRIDPSMPVVQGTATFENNNTVNSHSVTLPSNILQGDLLVMVLRPGDSRAITTPIGWTLLSSRSNNGVSYVLSRIAEGNEGSTQSISLSNTGRLAAITYRISNWEGTPEAVVATFNTNNPPSITTSWDASPTLFIAAMTNRRSDSNVTGAPSGFSNLLTIANNSDSNSSRVRASTAVRGENTKTIDPVGFSTSGTIDNPHSFTIAIKGKRKVLTVVANPLSKVYGQADPELTYTVTGFQGADNESILTGSLSRTSGQNVGTYTISQGNLSAADYIIEFTGANFSITPKTLSITPDSGQFKIVGESDPESLTFQTSGFEFSDNNSLLTGSLLRAEGESPGFYPITQGTLNVTSGNYTLQFTSGIQFEIRSNPSRYIVTASTTNPRAGTAVAISAQLADVNGSAIPEAGRTVTWSELIGTSGTFSSATSVTNAQGIATVQFTTSSTVGVSTKITAAGSGGLFGTSPEITTVDAVPTQLVFVQDPSGSTTVAGEAFASQPIVHILDADGNLVSSATKQITLSLSEGSGELRGNITLNAVNGVATFSGLSIDLVGSDKVIIAESEGLTSATTGSFSITAAAASLFTKYAGDQQATQVGTAVDIAPAVRITDIFGNPISGVSVSFAVESGGGSILPTTAVLTNADGVASLTSWILGTSPGQNTLTASALDLTPTTFTALGSLDAVDEFSANGTWLVPPDVTEIVVEAWGAGGAGGGVNGSMGNTRIGGGGGGGAYTKSKLAVVPGTTLTLEVGQGGNPTAVNQNGPNGGSTYIVGFENELFAEGGKGGLRIDASGDPASGGAGGSFAGSKGGLDIRPGQAGNRGGQNNFSNTNNTNGKGGDSGLFGIGGFIVFTGNGVSGTPPGGGGSGGASTSNTDRRGAAGGAGSIKITYPQPVNQFRPATSGNWDDNATWEQQFSNGQFARIDTKPSENSTVIISKPGVAVQGAPATVTVTVSEDLNFTGSIIVTSEGELAVASGKNLNLTSGSSLTIANEGLLTLPATGLVLGDGNVSVNRGSTLSIAHPEGVKAIGTAGGAIQNTGTRSFNAEANYHYNGTSAQVIGDGLPATVNGLVIDNPTKVTLDRPLEVTLDLEVNSGVLELEETLTVDLGMELKGSSRLLVEAGKKFQADLLAALTTGGTSRIVLEPGAKYLNLGISTPRLEVQQRLTGARGWRMLGAPVTGATYQSFLTGLESQGFPGSANPTLQPNVLWWDEQDGGTTVQGWRQPGNISQSVPAGRGHYVFVFNGAAKKAAGTGNYSDVLPLTLSTIGNEVNLNNGGFDFGVSYTKRNEKFQGNTTTGDYTQAGAANEGFNLIANPTSSDIDFFKSTGWTKTNIDQNIYIWDQNFNGGQGNFRTINSNTNLGGRLIAPFQAFWVRTNAAAPSLIMNNEVKAAEFSSFYGRVLQETPGLPETKLTLSVSGEGMLADATVRISGDGKDGLDPWDAFQLESLNNNWLNLYTLGSPKELTPLVINNLSLPEEGEKTIPLYLAAAKEGKAFAGKYTINWTLPADLPAGTRVVLMDHISKQAIDMSKTQSYTFSFQAPTSTNARIRTEDGAMKEPQAVVFSHEVKEGSGENFRTASGQVTRPFSIVIGYNGQGNNPEYRPETPKIFPPSPNPFQEMTQIKFYLPVAEEAEVKVYDMKGQEVGSFGRVSYPAGINSLEWRPAAVHLPKGVYLIQVQTETVVMSQKAVKF